MPMKMSRREGEATRWISACEDREDDDQRRRDCCQRAEIVKTTIEGDTATSNATMRSSSV